MDEKKNAPKRKYNKKPKAERDLAAENKTLREKCTLLDNQNKDLTVLCERFKNQYNCADASYQNLKSQVKGREAFLKNLITVAAEAAARMEDMRA